MAKKDREHIRKLREEANAIRRQEEAKRRRQRVLIQVGIIGGAILVVALVTGLIVFFVTTPRAAFPGAALDRSGNVELETSAGEKVQQPLQVNPEGYVAVGAVDAPVTIDYYYDYSCPHCVEYHSLMGSEFVDLMASGQVKINYHPVQFVSPYGRQAGAALLAATQYQPETFLKVNDGLFSLPAQVQQNWTKENYVSALSTFGVTNPDAHKAVQEGVYLQVINENTSKARRDAGVPGTPALGINGELLQTLPASPDELRSLVTERGAKLPEETPAAATPTPAPTSAG